MKDDVMIFILMVTLTVLWLWALRDLILIRFRYVWIRIAFLCSIMVLPAIGSIIFFLLKPEMRKRKVMFDGQTQFEKSPKMQETNSEVVT